MLLLVLFIFELRRYQQQGILPYRKGDPNQYVGAKLDQEDAVTSYIQEWNVIQD
jgi:hypothetical protein